MLALLLTLSLPGARAEIPASERWIASDRLAVGVAEDGSLINEDVALGLIWDPDGPAGTTPVEGDLLLQGWAVEAWLIDLSSDGVNYTWLNNAAHFGSALSLSWERFGEGPDAYGLVGEGASGPVAVRTWLSVSADGDVLWLSLELTALQDLSGLRVARLLDLDPDATVDGSYASLNASDAGWAVASGTLDGRSLAIAAAGGQGAVCAWCDDIDGLLAGAGDTSFADEQIGVVVEVGAMASGESTTLSFAYALSLDPEEAVSKAEAAATLHDADGDGLSDLDDCAPGDAAAFPGASQSWNGEDDDCDGQMDEDSVGSDDDGDGFTELDGDCDDTNVFVFPGAAPVSDVADADCDGAADDPDWGEDLADSASEDELKLEAAGCACASATVEGAPPGARLALAAAAIGALTRRRRPRRLSSSLASARPPRSSRQEHP